MAGQDFSFIHLGRERSSFQPLAPEPRPSVRGSLHNQPSTPQKDNQMSEQKARNPMTVEALKKHNPNLVELIKADAIEASKTAERERIMGILNLPEAKGEGDGVMPGPRWEMAKKLAAIPTMKAEKAIIILAALPSAAVSIARSEFEAYCAKLNSAKAAAAADPGEINREAEVEAFIARMKAHETMIP
jgi:hypothetical protein